MDENQQGREAKEYGVSDETAKLPHAEAARDAIQIALNGFTPGMTKTVTCTRETMQQIKDGGGTADEMLHGMIRQLKLNIALDMLANVAIGHHVTPDDAFVVEGSVVCMSEADFSDLLESVMKHVALAIGAAVEADRVTRAAQGDAA